MANTKISALPAKASPTTGTGTVFPVVQSGTTRQLNLADIRGSVVNVKNYGATGDGTTNDQAAIQAAVTAAGNGGCVYFPSGVYRITSEIATAAHGIRLVGEAGQSHHDGGR